MKTQFSNKKLGLFYVTTTTETPYFKKNHQRFNRYHSYYRQYFFHGPPVLALGLTKLFKQSKKVDETNIQITNSWLSVNNWLIDHVLTEIKWDISIDPELDLNMQGRYLMSCNHQSWVDTTVNQYFGLTRMPLTRFFTKWELIFIPFVGQAFKILGFPMMKRHSKQQIAKNPALKYQDMDEARKACEHLLSQPFTLLNYLEGTRFTAEKSATTISFPKFTQT